MTDEKETYENSTDLLTAEEIADICEKVTEIAGGNSQYARQHHAACVAFVRAIRVTDGESARKGVPSRKLNLPTRSEAERLAMLSEECGEIVQIIGKITRHGYDSWHPRDPDMTPNRDLLMSELGDLRAVLWRMVEASDVFDGAINGYARRKYEILPENAHFQNWGKKA